MIASNCVGLDHGIIYSVKTPLQILETQPKLEIVKTVVIMTTRFEKTMEGNLERILSEENLTSLGWLPVPSIDGSNCSSWAEIVMEMRESGMDIHVDGDWPTCLIVVRNQKLFHVSPEFCAKVADF